LLKSPSKENRKGNVSLNESESKFDNNDDSVNLSISSKNKLNENSIILKHTVSSLNKMKAKDSTENGLSQFY